MLKENNELILLKNFYNEDIAIKAKILLERAGINHKFIRARSNFENAFVSSNSNPTEIWVLNSEYDKSYELIKILFHETEEYIIDIKNFSSEELKDIIKNPDEWHDSYIIKAKEELTGRGIIFNQEETDAHMNEKLEAIKKGKDVHPGFIFILWIMVFCSVLFIMLGFLGGIIAYIGIISGFYFWKAKLKAFDNKRYNVFNKKTRIHGKYMFIIGLTAVLIFMVIYYYHFSKII